MDRRAHIKASYTCTLRTRDVKHPATTRIEGGADRVHGFGGPAGAQGSEMPNR